jgi:glycosyltransferase involved in cell wall biosynthesis
LKLLYAGHTYTIRANQAKIAALAKLPGVEVTLLTPDSWKGPLYANKTDRFSDSFRDHVIHHSLPSVFGGKESAFFYRGKIFSLIAELQPDIVHVEQGAYALSYAQILLALKRNAPNARATFFTWWNIPYQLTGFKATLERFNLQHSACAFAGNVEASAILKCSGFDRPIHVVPQLGVDLTEFSHPRNEGMRQNFGLSGFVIGYVGRVAEEKGVLDLVEAVGQMRTNQPKMLYILGSGFALEKVKARASTLGITLVCHAAVRNEDIPDHLAMLDCLILPSRSTPTWVEQFGHILIEAMAAGIPVIGSSSGEIPRVIERAGRIFAEGDVAGLTGILDALAENPKLRADLSNLGIARVEKKFTHSRIAEKQFRVYQWMMKNGLSVGQLDRLKSDFRVSSPQTQLAKNG